MRRYNQFGENRGIANEIRKKGEVRLSFCVSGMKITGWDEQQRNPIFLVRI